MRNRTFSWPNAFSVQFSRINTSKSFVISHSFSETLPRISLMLNFTCKERNDALTGRRVAQRQSIIHRHERGIFDVGETICPCALFALPLSLSLDVEFMSVRGKFRGSLRKRDGMRAASEILTFWQCNDKQYGQIDFCSRTRNETLWIHV